MIYKQGLETTVEILAPAGSYESFRAAVAAGADAVYAGGPRFGARAFAENFTEEQLLDAIDYAHLHGRKFYLTVNTLLKDTEMRELYHYLEPLYLGGLDAVIVQDVGVLEHVRTFFPELEIHASTQMTITGTEGARFLQRMGAARVVPARELSLEEIRHMKAETGMEIECFVHGALCYCYSGQCLLSSLIGGRSGNRGQCAQPCRLPYTAEGKKGYLLSLKDICTLELIPELAEAGIDSFKIEGRMKRPEYVAGVTAIYRKYLDLYLKNGKKDYAVKPEDKEQLMDLYNRGGFHTGYYHQKNGWEMIAADRPNHAGVAAVEAISQNGREVTARALTDIHKGDVLEFPGEKENYTFGRAWKKGDKVLFLAPKGKKIISGCVLHRIRNQQLLDELGESAGSGKIQKEIYGYLKLSVSNPASLIVCCGDASVEMCSEGIVERAEKTPLDEERVRRQIMKTGNTEFVFETLDIELDGNVFLPMQQLNELRRRALEALRLEICRQFHRVCSEKEELPAMKARITESQSVRKIPGIAVLAETKEQLRAICEFAGNSWRNQKSGQESVYRNPDDRDFDNENIDDEIDGFSIERVYIDSHIGTSVFEDTLVKEACRLLQGKGIEVFLAMPHIFRERTRNDFKKNFVSPEQQIFDGMLVRNYEGFQFLTEYGFDKKMILDHNLYIFNQEAKKFWKKLGVRAFTVPAELNRKEIEALGAEEAELIVYGYTPVMISAQCVTNTVSGCKKKDGCISLTDRFQNQFQVKNYCRDCYNVIYNSMPLCLFDQKEALNEIGPKRFRLQFSIENAAETKQILEQCRDVLYGHRKMEPASESFTRGHFRRGIT